MVSQAQPNTATDLQKVSGTVALGSSGDPLGADGQGPQRRHWPGATLIVTLSKDVLLPKHWVVERSFAWATRLRLVKDDERYATTLADLHIVAFVCLVLEKAALLAAGS